VFATADREEEVVPLERLPLLRPHAAPFQVQNVLAAAAAAWALGLPPAQVAAGLESFTGDARQLPGRYNVLAAGETAVIADYAHNPSALVALAAALDHFPHPRRTLVTTGCNRRDDDVIEMGRIAGDGFDRVLLYADRGNNDRQDGDLNGLLRRGLAAGKRVCEVHEVADESAAIRKALGEAQPGDLVVVGVEAIELSLALIEDCLGRTRAASGLRPALS
jgi:cyanophycin synthetase